MSEIKLNLLDSHTTLVGTVHGSTGDRLVAALSAEPDTIEELEAAFKRFERNGTIFGIPPCRSERCEIDERPWDAGILVIDLAARIVACESTYCLPLRSGAVEYHNGSECTGFPLCYQLSDDWLILRSIEEYQVLCKRQLKKRAVESPLDARAILYGKPLFDFIIQNVRLLNVRYTSACRDLPNTQANKDELNVRHASACRDSDVRYTSVCRDSPNAELKEIETTALVCHDSEAQDDLPEAEPRRSLLYEAIVDIHRRWLMTPRDDLNGQSPREVLFAKQDLIDLDLDSRMSQWSYFLEEPPCLSRDTNAYRFAGFGTHEWVMYYDLVRFLIRCAVDVMTNPALNDYLSFTPSFSLGPGETEEPETVSTVSNDETTNHLQELINHLSFTQGSGDTEEESETVSTVSNEEAANQGSELIKHLSFTQGSGDTEEESGAVSTVSNEESLITHLEELKNVWLSEPLDDCIPAEVIDNERRRRPEAMTGRSMVIDEDCPLCKLSGDLSESGLEITFCHFDGCNMEDEFAFSCFATVEEWEEEQRRLEQWSREWKLRQESEKINSSEELDDLDIPF